MTESKLSLIENILEQSPKVVLAHSKRSLYLPSRDIEDRFLQIVSHNPTDFRDEVEFFIAPKKPSYSVSHLNKLMKTVIPIKADRVEKAYKPSLVHGDIYYGRLIFEENIGHMAYEVEIIVDDMNKELYQKGFNDKKFLATKPISRQIKVNMFPNQDIALIVGTDKCSPRFMSHLTEEGIEMFKEGKSAEDVYKKIR